MNHFKLTLWVLLGLLLFSSNALAYFETGVNGSLVLSIYNAENNEVAIDLGRVLDTVTLQNTTVAAAGSWNIDQFGGLELSDLRAGVRGMDTDTGTGRPQRYNHFFGLNTTTVPEIGISKFLIFKNANDMSFGTYSESGEQTALIPSSHDNSYFWRSGANSELTGYYSGLNGSASEEISEADMGLLATQGYVDLYLYNFLRVLSTATIVTPTAHMAVVRMMADGSVVMNPTVPLPGSLILLSSGLLGMVGIRRKNS